MIPQMRHLNGDILCSVGITRTGPKAGHDDTVQICILPLDNFIKPSQELMPFYLDLMPKRKHLLSKETYDSKLNWEKICKICEVGIDPDLAADRFEAWFEQIGLRDGKKIVPLAYEWEQTIPFLKDWLCYLYTEKYFSHAVRDIRTVALYANDRANTFAEPAPYPKTTLTYLFNVLDVPRTQGQELIQDCVCIAESYRRMIGYSHH